MGNVWLQNSFYTYVNPTVLDITVLYTGLFYGMGIIFHSYYLHRRRFKLVRFLSDMASAALICQCVVLLFCDSIISSRHEKIVLTNAISLATFGVVISLVDMFLTFYRYSVVAGGTSTMHKTIVGCCVLIYTLSWWPCYTLLPFFLDM